MLHRIFLKGLSRPDSGRAAATQEPAALSPCQTVCTGGWGQESPRQMLSLERVRRGGGAGGGTQEAPEAVPIPCGG